MDATQGVTADLRVKHDLDQQHVLQGQDCIGVIYGIKAFKRFVEVRIRRLEVLFLGV